MKYVLGLSAGFHDASAAVINSHGEILFAGHSERYSRLKNDPNLSDGLINELCPWQYDTIAWYERPWLHNLQHLYSGQRLTSPWTVRGVLKQQLGGWYSNPAEHERCFPHHLSHAAAGFQTSPYDRATVVVIDAIGEFDTISIYAAEYDQTGRAVYRRLWGQRYPHSVGLFYSAITQRVGLHPLDEEYITMGMAAYSKHGNVYARPMREQLVDSVKEVRFKQNLHLGVDPDFMHGVDNYDIAGAGQHLVEELIYSVMERARNFGWSTNLVYQGGVALNCLANRNLGNYFENIWIMPNPGDSGSSLGAAALAYGGKIKFDHAYLGHNISGDYPVNSLLDSLLRDKIVGVASGRAEFGPRALGNLSLIHI